MLSNRTTWALALTLLASFGCDPGPAMPGDEPLPGQLGAICARNADCDSGLCLAAGRCTDVCASTVDCPTTWSCDGLPGTGLVCQCNAVGASEVCNGVDDECNGRVDDGAVCPDGLVCEGGSCLCPVAERCDGACPDLSSDVRHCGACGNACAAGEVCEAGACVVNCSDTSTRCGDSCVDLNESDLHCGACDNACGAGGHCSFGGCECSGSLMPCGAGGCVDPLTDRSNCGGCGNACNSGELCRDGACECGPGLMRCGTTCTDLSADVANCGGCGVRCGSGQACEAGACVARCTAPEVRCGETCVDTRSDTTNCGLCGTTCEGGEVCAAGVCRRDCGALSLCGGACVDVRNDSNNCGGCASHCRTGTSCINGSCMSPVPVGTECTANSQCQPGAGGLCLDASDGFTDGYCSRLCEAAEDCPVGSRCQDVDWLGAAFCMQECDSLSDCRSWSGYVCSEGGFFVFPTCVPG